MNDPAALTQALLSDEATSLQDVMETIHLADGEVLFQRGELGDAFYILEFGQVRIFTLDEGGEELTLNTMGPGEAFGELALLDNQVRSASAVAVGPTILRRLRREDFLTKVHTSPALTQSVIHLLSQRTRHMTDYIERLGHWARLVADGKYSQAMESIQAEEDTPDRALTAVADAVKSMVQAVQEREDQLRQEVTRLRIQIDETKRKKQVAEITETDYFQSLARQAEDMRKKLEE
jgi:CRP-like cAMP-binding protein